MHTIEYLKENHIDVEKSLELLGDIETYDEILEEFYNNIEEKKKKLKEYLQSDIENYNGWKLLGDYIVAKEVKDGNLIIRKIWQRHPWQYKDMMLYKVNSHKNNPK